MEMPEQDANKHVIMLTRGLFHKHSLHTILP